MVDKLPVSQICNEAQIQPSLFYSWQRELLEAAPGLCSTHRSPSREKELEEKIAVLDGKLARKESSIAEVS